MGEVYYVWWNEVENFVEFGDFIEEFGCGVDNIMLYWIVY